MKKLVLAASIGLSFLAAGCGSPNCDALKAQCAACTNASGKSSCNTAYTTYTTVGGSAGDSSCKTVVDAKTFAADSTSCK